MIDYGRGVPVVLRECDWLRLSVGQLRLQQVLQILCKRRDVEVTVGPMSVRFAERVVIGPTIFPYALG
jgi:hypothetical protein